MGRTAIRGVVVRFVKLALKNQPIPIYGKGDQTRSFCFIDDNIDTCIKTLENDLHVNDVLNIGNDEEISILELTKKVINISNSDSKIICVCVCDTICMRALSHTSSSHCSCLLLYTFALIIIKI